MIDALAIAQPADDFLFFIPQFRWDDDRDWTPDGFFRSESKNALRPGIQLAIIPFRPLEMNGVVGGLYNRGEPVACFLAIPSRANVLYNRDKMLHLAACISNRGNGQVDPDDGPIFPDVALFPSNTYPARPPSLFRPEPHPPLRRLDGLMS